jgi:hypothetical protein
MESRLYRQPSSAACTTSEGKGKRYPQVLEDDYSLWWRYNNINLYGFADADISSINESRLVAHVINCSLLLVPFHSILLSGSKFICPFYPYAGESYSTLLLIAISTVILQSTGTIPPPNGATAPSHISS